MPFPIDLSRLPTPPSSGTALLAIDIGGTSVKRMLVNHSGERRQLPSIATGERSVAEVVAAIAGDLPEALNGDVLCRCGVGFPGIVREARTIIGSPNLPQWIGVDLAAKLSEAIGCPVRIANDANLAALGESLFGGESPVAELLFLTLGTGVGTGIVTGGKLLNGATGFAGEGGHITVEPDGAACGCGRCGCLEAHFSERALAREAFIAGLPRGTGAKELFDDAKNGRLRAKMIVQKGIDHLAIGISGMCALLDPQEVVLGGGISQAGDYLLQELDRALCIRLQYPGYTLPKIRLSTLGADAGLYGALAL